MHSARGVSYIYLLLGAQQMTPRNSGKHVFMNFIWSNWTRDADGSWSNIRLRGMHGIQHPTSHYEAELLQHSTGTIVLVGMDDAELLLY